MDTSKHEQQRRRRADPCLHSIPRRRSLFVGLTEIRASLREFQEAQG